MASSSIILYADRAVWLDKTNADTNQKTPASTGIFLRKGTTGLPNTVRRAIMHFDLSPVPTGLIDFVVTSATVTMDRVAGSPGAVTVFACKITQTDWVDSEVTWNSYKTGNAWAVAGGDYSLLNNLSGGIANDPMNLTGGLVLVQDALSTTDSLDLLVRYQNEATTSTQNEATFEGNGVSGTYGSPILTVYYNYTPGTKVPVDPIVRVSALIHRYNRGVYNIEAILGEVVADSYGIPVVSSEAPTSYQPKAEKAAGLHDIMPKVFVNPPSSEQQPSLLTPYARDILRDKPQEASILAQIQELGRAASAPGITDYARSVLKARIAQLQQVLRNLYARYQEEQ